MPTLDFYFEFASSYSYPAAMRIGGIAAHHNVNVRWCPFLLGPLFRSQQGLTDSPFNVVRQKGEYMWRDIERICARENIPFRKPDIFPQKGLLAARVATALPDADRPAFARAIYQANFAEGRSISDPVTVARAAHLSEAEISTLAETSKDALRLATEHAAARGVFGAPTFFTPDGEMFWGNDRLEEAIDWTLRGSLA